MSKKRKAGELNSESNSESKETKESNDKKEPKPKRTKKQKDPADKPKEPKPKPKKPRQPRQPKEIKNETPEEALVRKAKERVEASRRVRARKTSAKDDHLMRLVKQFATLPKLDYPERVTEGLFRQSVKTMSALFFGSYKQPLMWFANRTNSLSVERCIEARNQNLLGEPSNRETLLPQRMRYRREGGLFLLKFFSSDNMRLKPRLLQQFESTPFPKELRSLISDYVCVWQGFPDEQRRWIRYDEYYAQFLKSTSPYLHRLYVSML
jgi:hypothetical protein